MRHTSSPETLFREQTRTPGKNPNTFLQQDSRDESLQSRVISYSITNYLGSVQLFGKNAFYCLNTTKRVNVYKVVQI
jgi:hypothetical protein